MGCSVSPVVGHATWPVYPGDTEQPTTGSVYARCTSTGFTLTWPGDSALGTAAVDAQSIAFTVTATHADGTMITHAAAATATLTGPPGQPNGPGCGPTCYTRAATVTTQ